MGNLWFFPVVLHKKIRLSFGKSAANRAVFLIVFLCFLYQKEAPKAVARQPRAAPECFSFPLCISSKIAFRCRFDIRYG